MRWRNEFRPELTAEGYARCSIGLEPQNGAVKLTINHTIERTDSKFIEAVSGVGRAFSPISSRCSKQARSF